MEKADLESKEFLKNLGERIRFLRKAKHLKQIELGFRCDIEKQNMRKLEAGNANPTALTLRKIAKALEISISELTSGL